MGSGERLLCKMLTASNRHRHTQLVVCLVLFTPGQGNGEAQRGLSFYKSNLAEMPDLKNKNGKGWEWDYYVYELYVHSLVKL